MTKVITIVASFLFATFTGSVFAEPQSVGTGSSNENAKVIGVPEDVIPVVAHPFMTSAEYEGVMKELLQRLNAASHQAAILSRDSNNTVFRGDAENMMRIVLTAENILENTLAVIEKYAEKDPVFKASIDDKLAPIKDKLNRVDAYHFGPDRESFTISQVSNEGKGTVEIGERSVRYAVGPGLSATPVQEYEVHAVERLADGTYKVAMGIMYKGQESVTMYWDPRPYSFVDWHLDYHNVSIAKTQDLYFWLVNGPITSQPVAFSENKTAAKASKITSGKSLPNNVFTGSTKHLTKKGKSKCDC